MKDSWSISGPAIETSISTDERRKRPQVERKWVQRWLKRGVDIVVSAGLLILLSPAFLIIGLIVKLDSPGPMMFNRPRVGKDGKPFVMYKFRTMEKNAENRLKELAHLNEGGQYMIKIHNDPRVTRVGRFLRKTSLDEFPQLINVLKGEMSLVGPRPQAPNEVALYNDHQRRRLEVVPGITGLWQVTYRDHPSFDVWVELDLQYIDTWSFDGDLKILFKTVGVVLIPIIHR